MNNSMTTIGRRLVMVLVTLLPATVAADEWRQFRGPAASGMADGPLPPISWNVEEGSAVAWNREIAGLGLASPIVSRGRVFVVTAVNEQDDQPLKTGLYGDIASVEDDSVHTWKLICLDQPSGRLLWSRAIHQGVPRVKRHTKASHANATPAADGRHVVVMLGSEGLHCFDYCGRQLWKREYPLLDSGYYRVPEAQWGFASSPVIHQGRVLVQCDVQQGSFLAAYDVSTGRQLWRTPRDDVPTWSTPTVVEAPSGPQVIVNGYRHSGGYDLRTGAEIWKLSSGGDIPVPAPVQAGNLVILSSAHGPQRPLRAIRMDAVGDLDTEEANSAIAWNLPRDGIYMQTPLVIGDLLYACRLNGVLSCYETHSGKLVYRERLGAGTSGFTSSPVAAGNRLYFTSEAGEVFVVRAGKTFELLSTNPLNDTCLSTPAIANGTMFFRTTRRLIAISNDPNTTSLALRSPATFR